MQPISSSGMIIYYSYRSNSLIRCSPQICVEGKGKRENISSCGRCPHTSQSKISHNSASVCVPSGWMDSCNVYNCSCLLTSFLNYSTIHAEAIAISRHLVDIRDIGTGEIVWPRREKSGKSLVISTQTPDTISQSLDNVSHSHFSHSDIDL